MSKAELIFIPIPEPGHLPASIELANRMISLDCRIEKITILFMKLPYLPHADAYTRSITASQTCLRLINLPEIQNPPPIELLETSAEAYIYNFIVKNIPFVRKTINDIVSSSSPARVAGLVLDFFCVPMIDVGNEVSLPSYIFLTSNLGFLGTMKHIPKRHSVTASEFKKNSGDDELIPSFVNRVPTKVLPPGLFDKHSYEAFAKLGKRFVEAKGILVNTFSQLEPHAADYFSKRQDYPPVYPIGPVLNIKDRPKHDLNPVQHEGIMKWLDGQPESSVVFLCFGSMGVFGAPQVKEIAHGLELAGFRFLWSIRTDPMRNEKRGDLLPDGFLERVVGWGIVCGWAPQVEVLAHKAIGGFVSHCGWNSILESLWYGVPIATWPMYAEQQLNAFTMVRELRLAVEMRLDYVAGGGELVMADEIARAIRSLMEGDDVVRKMVKAMAEKARKAVIEGGSSSVALQKFVKDIIG